LEKELIKLSVAELCEPLSFKRCYLPE